MRLPRHKSDCIKAGVSIEELPQNIVRRDPLQALNVRSVINADGAEAGMFEIAAGGLRCRTLDLLVKAKRLTKTAPVPCVVREAGCSILAKDDSLMVFTINPDHTPQEKVWEATKDGWSKEPYQIRRMLTETTTRVGDSGRNLLAPIPVKLLAASC